MAATRVAIFLMNIGFLDIRILDGGYNTYKNYIEKINK